MNSAAATFWVQYTPYVVQNLTQHMHQETNNRGITTAKPVGGELRLTLDFAPHDTLLASWAYDPHKALLACVVFDALDGLSPSLTLELEEAYCVSFEEHFETQPGGRQSSIYWLVSVVARRFTKRGTDYPNAWPASGS